MTFDDTIPHDAKHDALTLIDLVHGGGEHVIARHWLGLSGRRRYQVAQLLARALPNDLDEHRLWPPDPSTTAGSRQLVIERRAQVLALAQQGVGVRAVADQLGLAYGVVRDDLRKLRADGYLPEPPARSRAS